ncbi:MAG: DinB family protein [Dehalococcoidia bacterium]|nr:MAG: DinB family protein [Dehalococcoidia bacterium]
MTTTTKIEQLVARFAAVNDEAIALVEARTDAQWRATAAAEGWSAAVVAHHIAVVHDEFMPLVRAFAGGETFSPGSSMSDVDRINAEHARDFADVSQPETIEALRTNGAALAELLLAITDDGLGRTAGAYGGREMTVAQVVEWIIIGHAQEHLASLRATVAG